MIFKRAKIKLTAWYLVIIMLISLSLSFMIYKGVDTITSKALFLQKSRMERRWQPNQLLPKHKPIFEEETLLDIKSNLLWSLVRINIAIVAISGISGFFLAGRTLKPIEDMVNEQKRFISDASHELKTPLTALKTELEVTLRENKHTEKDLINIIKSNLEEVNKLHKLAESLLKESRYQKENYTMIYKDVDLKEITQNVVKNLLKRAKKNNIKITQKLSRRIVRGDKNSLSELVSILLDNAIKFSQKDSEVILNLKKDGKFAVLEVADRGVGIDKSDQPFIFNRFYQADSSRTKIKNDGFGLGLSIVKKIVKTHSGSISVKSELGKGSTFTIKIPLA